MSDTKVRVPKATVLLKEDHQALKKLFKKYDKLEEGEQAEKGPIFQQVKEILTVHSKIEEEIFYPAVERGKDPQSGLLVREAQEEHRIVKQLLDEMASMTSGSEDFEAKMKVLKESVLHHAEEEEKDIFPVFVHLERTERDRISEMLLSRKRELSGDA